jgi:uncharacterized protein with PIN domain
MKFISDRMLGRLSRWLSIFGHDALETKKQENEDDVLSRTGRKRRQDTYFKRFPPYQESDKKKMQHK